jgi:hypothetical protein
MCVADFANNDTNESIMLHRLYKPNVISTVEGVHASMLLNATCNAQLDMTRQNAKIPLLL